MSVWAALAAAASAGTAQAEPPATPSAAQPMTPAAAESSAGVTSYPASFFAPYRPNTALDMVNRLPGFGLDEGANVRGFGGAAGNVLLDGARPASKDESLGALLGRIPAAQVERVDLIRGGAPGIDMQGRSLIANVVRRKGDVTQQVGLIRLERFSEDGRILVGWRYDLNRQLGPRAFDLGLGKLLNYDDSAGRGFRVRRDASGREILREAAGHEEDGWGHYARVNGRGPLLGGVLRLNGAVTDSPSKGEEHFDGTLGRLDVIDRESDLEGEVGLNYARDFGPRWSVELVGLQTFEREDFVSRAEGYRNVRFEAQGEEGERIGRFTVKHRPAATLTVEAGGETAFNFLEGANTLQVNGAPVPLPFSEVRVEEDRAELFALANWRATPVLTLEAGFRHETSTIRQIGQGARERDFQYPKPRFTAAWTPAAGSSLRLRVEREVGQLDFGDFVSEADLTTGVVASGNPDLAPDQAWVYELAAERRFWDTGALVLTLRRRDITDVVDRIPVTATDPVTGVSETFEAPGNIGDGVAQSVSLDATLPLRRLGVPGGEFRADLTWRRSRVIDPTTGEARRISGERPDSLELRYRHDLPSKNLVFNLVWFDGWRETYYNFDQVTRVGLDRFAEAEVQWRPRPRTTLFLSLANLSPFTLRIDRDVYTGRRDANPLAFAEERRTQSQVRAIVRLRQEFG